MHSCFSELVDFLLKPFLRRLLLLRNGRNEGANDVKNNHYDMAGEVETRPDFITPLPGEEQERR